MIAGKSYRIGIVGASSLAGKELTDALAESPLAACDFVLLDDDDQAAELANGTGYGLVASVWTRELSRAHRLARAIRSGQVYVNTYGVGGGAELPFGGFGKSGFGREKGIEGLNSYLQTKNVCVKI